MKTKILIITLILFLKAINLAGLESGKTIKNLWNLIIDWGYLENYHPLLINCYENSDSLFCQFANQIIEANHDYSGQNILEILNTKLLGVHELENKVISVPFNHITRNRNLFPISDTDTSNINRRVFFNNSTYQLIFKKSIVKSPFFPSASLRILGLAKIWNNYKYYYPYQEILPKETIYQSILLKYIRKVLNCQNENEFHLAILELASEFRDAHSHASSLIIRNQFGTKTPAFKTRYIDGKILITSYYSKFLFDKTGLRPGDIILKINGKNIHQAFGEIAPYVSYSNSQTLYRNLCNLSLKTNQDSMSIKIRRDGNCLDFIVPTYNTIDLYSLDYKENENNSLTKLNDSTILIKCKYIDTTGFRKTLSEDKLLKWFIFDLRSSTEWIKPIVEDFFINRKTAFCSTFTPLPSRPGFFSDPTSITIGPGNQELFIKGAHVIILVNENTQSQGEFQTMFLQSIPNSITIGSHTAGSDGNVTEYPIPGNITIGMTGLGIQYPDGTKSQKNGVKIDYYLSPILKSAKKGIDQDLDFALKLIERTKNQSSTH